MDSNSQELMEKFTYTGESYLQYQSIDLRGPATITVDFNQGNGKVNSVLNPVNEFTSLPGIPNTNNC